MAKKTWVKLKRGLLIDPKHRMALGNRIWLYLFMLDVADWDTGKVIEWRDKAAADELQMPLSTVRTQRREIEEAGYISVNQKHNRLVITIKKWVNPREYTGQVYNIGESDQEYPPQESTLKQESDNEGVNEGYIEGVNEGIQNLTPLHINHISQVTSQFKKGEIDLFEACAKVYEKLMGRLVTGPSQFSLMVSNFAKHGVTPEDYGNAIIDMRNDPRYKRATNPTSFEKYALGIADKRKNPVVRKNGNQQSNAEHDDAVINRILERTMGNV
jgi:hypothetical protein